MFASQFPSTAHASYEALLADPKVEAVYISTPHPDHAKWSIKAAEAGKHILCEKPLTMTYPEALEVVEAARKNDVFLMEAFMYRCQPQTARLVELIHSKVIGEVRFVAVTFSFVAANNLKGRFLNKELGGGGILDVGCYCTSMARLVAGAARGGEFAEPMEVRGTGEIGSESEVDEYAIASLKFEGGILAQLACGVRLDLGSNLRVVGTEGSILVPDPWTLNRSHKFSKLIVFKEGIPDEILIEASEDIYSVEADHVAKHLSERQSPCMSWPDSLGNMKTLDAWRASL